MGITINLLHLAKFVDVSRKKIQKKYQDLNFDEEIVKKLTDIDLKAEIKDGMQTFLYQNNTLCAGTGQAVFLSVSVWLNEDPEYTDDLILVYEEMLRQRIAGIKDKNGLSQNPNFPKILYFLDEDNMKGGKYYNTTILSAECSAKRLTPDYLSVKKHKELKQIPTPPMGCRSMLNAWKNEQGYYQTFGRFNIGVQTLNLPYIAMENNPEHSEVIFFKNLDHYLDIAYRDAIWRINHTAKIKAGQSPLLWVYGGLTRLNPDETLEKVIYSPRTTVSIGISGLYECVKYITNMNQFEGVGNKFAHKFFDYVNKRNAEMTTKFGTYFGLYGTPMETKTDDFAKVCLEKFGQVGDGSQRQFLTNSYHHLVSDKVDAFTKITDEVQFSDKTTSGAITYCEVPNLSNNLETMLALIEHIGNTCLYAEINSEISNCSGCGFSGYDFKKITAEDGTVRWQCPCCHESDPAIVRTSYRICGYISNYTPNVGRSQDILNRVKHLNLEET